MKTYAFLPYRPHTAVSFSPFPFVKEGKKKTFPVLLSFFYFLIFDLTVGAQSFDFHTQTSPVQLMTVLYHS